MKRKIFYHIVTAILLTAIIGLSFTNNYATVLPKNGSEASTETEVGDMLEQDNAVSSETVSENLYSESWLTPVGDDSVHWPTPDEVAAHYPIPGNDQTIDLSTEEWVDDGAHWKGKLLKIKDGIPLEGDNRVYSGVCMVKVNPYCYLLSCKKGMSIKDYENQLVGSSNYTYKDIDDEMVFWASFFSSWYCCLFRPRNNSDDYYKNEILKVQCEFDAYSVSRSRVIEHAELQPDNIPNYKNISFVDYINRTDRAYLYDEIDHTRRWSGRYDEYDYVDAVARNNGTTNIPSAQYYDILSSWVGQEKIKQLRNKAENLGIPEELYIVKYLRRIIKENGTYNYDVYYHRSTAPANSFEVFLETGLVVCTGFSDTFESLCSAAGIITVSVGNESHIWNKTFLNGNWYKIDITAENSSVY